MQTLKNVRLTLLTNQDIFQIIFIFFVILRMYL